jgi:hypothetical protein
MVELLPCPINAAWNSLERKRRLLWFNEPRNKLIASIVRALAQGDTSALRQAGMRLRREQRRRLSNACDITVLVESVRHAAALLRLLPGFVVLDAIADERGARRDHQELPRARSIGTIITLTRAWMDGIDTDVLVRATGGRGPLRLDGSPAQGVEVAVSTQLLIDFSDPSDASTRSDSALRLRQYRQQGLRLMTPKTKR